MNPNFDNSDDLKINFLDSETLSKVFDLYSDAIFRYVLRLCNDISIADQVVGDVFSQLVEKVALGKGPKTNIRSYLYQIAYHRIVDLSREKKHMISIEETEIISEEISVHSKVEDDLVLEALSQAIRENLTNEQRHVITLRYLESFNLIETAEVMDKNVNAIKSLQKRGVEKLQQIMKEHYEK